jgi:hypothetical protein
MKRFNIFLLIVFLLSSCAPALTIVPTITSTQTASLTPTPKIYTLRIEFSTSADWSSLSISDTSSISDVRIVDKQGELTDAVANNTYIGINQTLENAQKLNKVSVTVDLDIIGNSTNASIPFLLQKGAINNSTVRFYNVYNGKTYLLLQEVSQDGYIVGQTDTNPYNFSFDLKPLFQDVASLPSPTQTPVATPIGNASKIIFEYSSSEIAQSELAADFPNLDYKKGFSHVFISNINGTNKTLITQSLGGNYNSLVALSPDKTKAIIRSFKEGEQNSGLYVFNLQNLENDPVLLGFSSSAKWIDNSRIVYAGDGDKGLGIYIINSDGTNAIQIVKNTSNEVLGIAQNLVFWNTYTKNGRYSTYPMWWTNLDGSETGKLTYNGRQIGISIASFNRNNIAFSPDGTRVAWVDAGVPESGHKENFLQIANLRDIDHPFLSIELIFSGPDLKWRHNGKSLIVFDEASVNFGVGKGSNNYGYFEVSAETGEVIKNFNLSDEMMGAGDDFTPLQCGDISPDDKLLPCLVFVSNKDKTAEGFLPAQLNLLNLETRVMSEVNEFNFFFMGFDARKIFWIP